MEEFQDMSQAEINLHVQQQIMTIIDMFEAQQKLNKEVLAVLRAMNNAPSY
jgi:restriction endonuclease S subunit